jgi:hypothetical protein
VRKKGTRRRRRRRRRRKWIPRRCWMSLWERTGTFLLIRRRRTNYGLTILRFVLFWFAASFFVLNQMIPVACR